LLQIIKTYIDWIDVKNKCRTTVNKDYSDKEATSEFKRKLLISEHSPIRLLKIEWKWSSIKYWLSTEFSRHHIGWEKWISTQRDDRTNIDRNKSPQDTLVNMDVDANVQALINVSRLRLCNCAHPEARQKMEELKREIHKFEPEVANVMQKNCVYRAGCSEFEPCGWWKGFQLRNLGVDMTDINARYRAANREFYGEEY
jgi:thymidylate synthase ThyX